MFEVHFLSYFLPFHFFFGGELDFPLLRQIVVGWAYYYYSYYLSDRVTDRPPVRPFPLFFLLLCQFSRRKSCRERDFLPDISATGRLLSSSSD